jgi:type I restriction enzyme, S subunit
MKKGWETRKLGDVCEVFADGDWVESEDQSTEGIRLIQTGNVGEGFFKDRAEKARYISEATFKRLRCTEIFEGDCLVSRLPDPVGRSCILPETGERMITAVDCTIVRFKSDQLLPSFFNLYSQSADYLGMVAKECTGTTRNRISRSNLALTPIPVPPLAEQQRIVGVLDEAFEGIATAKAAVVRNLDNARALAESYLQNILDQGGEGWVKRRLGEVASIARGGSPRPIKAFLTAASNGINWIKISDATASGKYIFTTEQKIISEGAKRSRIVHSGDFLLSNSMSFGRPYIMRTTGCIHDGWLVLSDYGSHLDQDYLYHLLGSQLVFRQFDSLAAGSTVRNLNIELASRVELPIPPLEQQREIANQLDAMFAATERLESIWQEKCVALEHLKGSLLHHAFTGQL